MNIYSAERLTAAQTARIRELDPSARLVGADDLERDPSLAERVEVSYGHFPPGFWPRMTGLKWLQSTWAGLDTLLENPGIRSHPAILTNVHIHTRSISEHLWGMCLMLTRNLHIAVQRQGLHQWDRGPMMEGLSSLSGRTLCVAGLGEIGRQCARMGKALGMRVIGIRRRAAADGREGAAAEADEVVGPEDRVEAFRQSRVIMVLLPHTARTMGFVSRREMDAMKGAYLLNAGRGTSVDTDALVDALKSGKVRGAGLDVTDPEPLPQNHPLWDMPNVIITPHYSGIHPGYDDEAFAVFLDNLTRYVKGEPLHNVVDKSEGY